MTVRSDCTPLIPKEKIVYGTVFIFSLLSNVCMGTQFSIKYTEET